MTGPPSLEPLQVAVLDDEMLDSLLTDLGALAVDLRVVLRRAPEPGGASSGVYNATSLNEAAEGLRAHAVLGAQVRYRYQGCSWCDTLSPAEGGVRLVRIRE